MNSFDSFTLAPMSAGDIIDRAVRLYRRNFLALLRIVLWPSLVAFTGSILSSLGWHNATLARGDGRVVVAVLLVLTGFLLWAIGKAAFYVVLGGSSRSLIAHFFDGKPILARDVYRVARERVWSLIGATLMIGLLIMSASTIAYLFIVTIVMILWLMWAAIAQVAPVWLAFTIVAIFAFVFAVALIVSALLIYCRIVFVPQILMVEGKGVFNSIGRSFSLAGGQLWRIAALILFWSFVGWSVLLLLFLPLGYISDWVTPFTLDQPPWFDIAWQTVWQLSEILLMPILMIGCTLLYIDCRVRKEGFDVELLANRTLAQPLLPLQPPLYPSAPQWTPAPIPSGPFAYSILGLDDYSPGSADPIPAEGPQFAPEATRKSCQWCGAESNIEDRFCRQCGSAF